MNRILIPQKGLVYQWSRTKPNCKSSYIAETSRSLCEWVKEHSKERSNSAIYQHCSTKGHPPPNIDQFKGIDQEKSQIAIEAKEAKHIQKLDPELNRNVAKMVIPHVFDSLLDIKPKKSKHCFITISGGRISRHWYKPHTILLLCR